MRTGDESFLVKGFSFYDAMVMPALGLKTIAVYEVLRRNVWRSLTQGKPEARAAFRAGRLVARVNQKSLAEMTGMSDRSVLDVITELVRIGWLTKERVAPGGPLLYELGYRAEGDGIEVFYADSDLRRLWLKLEKAAREADLLDVLELPRTERLAITKAWFEAKGGANPPTRSGCGSPSNPVQEGSRTGCGSRIDNPSGEEVDNSEQEGGAASAGSTPLASQSAPRSEAQRSSGPPLRPNSPSSASPPLPRDLFESVSKAEYASLKGPTPKQFRDELVKADAALKGVSPFEKRRARLEAVAAEDEDGGGVHEVAKGVANAPVEDRRARLAALATESDPIADRVKRELVQKRQQQLDKARTQEQRAANLKGGTKPLGVRKQLKQLETIWLREMNEAYPELTIAPWTGKDRGIAQKLVDLYGGQIAETLLTYVVRRWDKIQARFKKPGSKHPSMGWVMAMQANLALEAQEWAKFRTIEAEWEQWFKANPHDPYPPPDLERRYQEARKAFESMERE